MSIGERRRKTNGREYDTPPPIPCTPKELNALLDKWIADGIFKPNQVFREPTEEEQRDLRFCRLHNYVQHPTAECLALRRLVHHRIKAGTLKPSQQEVQRNSFPNHKGKGVAAVVICADPGEDVEENPALPAAAITTLQQSSKFKILFDQLGLTTKERKIVTEALVSITSGAGIECLSAEIPKDRALLQESTEITFSDEDMKVGYPDHRRPLHLVASINQIPIKRALVDTGASVNLIPLSTLKAAGILERKIQGCPIEVIGFGERDEYIVGHIQLWPNRSDRIRWKGRVHRRPHSAVAKSRPHSFSSSVPCSENRGFLSCAFGETMVAQAPIGSIHLSSVCKRNIKWQDETHSRKPLTIRVSRSPFSRNYVLRPMGPVRRKLSIEATRYLCT